MHNKLLCITCSEHHVVLCHFSGKRDTPILDNYISFKPALPLTAQSLAVEIADAVGRNNLFSETYHLALSSHFAILRNWEFPFTAKSKIIQAMTFELEQELPFQQTDVVTDIHISRKSGNGRNVISATIPKQFLNTFLTELQSHDIDPERIDLDAFALVNAISGIETTTSVLLLDIDAARCLFSCIHDGQPVALSQIPHGLTALKKRVIQELSLTEDSFDRQILFTNVASPVVTEPENAPFQQALCDSLNQLAKSVLLGINTSKAPIETILLSGEITKIQGIDQFISEALDCPVTSLYKCNNAPVIQNLEDKNDWIDCLQAYGLMQSSRTALHIKKRGINFRKDEFSFRQQTDPILSTAKHLTAIAVIIMLAWTCLLAAEGRQQEKEAHELALSLRKEFRTALPDVRGNFSAFQYTSILKGRLQQLKGSTPLITAKQVDTLDLLNELHKGTSEKLDVALEDISIDIKRIDLRGNADSLNTLEKFRASLSRNPLLKNIEIRGANIQKTEQVRFELSIMREQ